MINKEKNVHFKNIENRILLIYVAMVLCVAVFLSVAFLNKSSQAIQNNAISLISVNMTQLEININSYLGKVEQTSALLFSDENYYKYDETSSAYDAYTKIQYETAITNKIVDLGIMENYSDFGIVYADDYTVGWVSNTTKELFEKGELYSELVSHITNVKTSDGWFFGANGNFDRLFYVKKLNDNAVIIASIYSRELASVFTFPDELKGMVISLINDDGQILYSTNKDEIGSLLPVTVMDTIRDNYNITISNSSQIIDVKLCKNGWRLASFVPTNVILKDLQDLKIFTITIAIILAATFIIAGVIMFERSTKSVDKIVSALQSKADSDGLSGLLNKKAYEEKVRGELELTISGCSVAHMIMDVDHFKSINDSEGHAYGDEVIVRTSKLLQKVLPSEVIVGRIGGDEFAFFLKATDKDSEEMREYVESILNNLSDKFLVEFAREHEKYDVSVSIGAFVFKHVADDVFEDVYKNSDAALYVSKESGRNRHTFFEEGMTHE